MGFCERQGVYSHRKRANVHGVYNLALRLLVLVGIVVFLAEREQHVAFARIPYSDQSLLPSGVESEPPWPRRRACEILARTKQADCLNALEHRNGLVKDGRELGFLTLALATLLHRGHPG